MRRSPTCRSTGNSRSETSIPSRASSTSRPETKTLVVSQENVLGDPADPWVGPNQVIRVLARAILAVTGTRPVDPDWDRRGRAVQQYELRVKRLDIRFDETLAQLCKNAMQAGKWKGTAAARDRQEYWATGVLAYFDALGQAATPPGAAHPIATRESLKSYDPDLYCSDQRDHGLRRARRLAIPTRAVMITCSRSASATNPGCAAS